MKPFKTLICALLLVTPLTCIGLSSHGDPTAGSGQISMATDVSIYLYDANGNPVLQPGAYIQRNDVFDSFGNLIGNLVGTEIVNQSGTQIGYTQDAS